MHIQLASHKIKLLYPLGQFLTCVSNDNHIETIIFTMKQGTYTIGRSHIYKHLCQKIFLLSRVNIPSDVSTVVCELFKHRPYIN